MRPGTGKEVRAGECQASRGLQVLLRVWRCPRCGEAPRGICPGEGHLLVYVSYLKAVWVMGNRGEARTGGRGSSGPLPAASFPGPAGLWSSHLGSFRYPLRQVQPFLPTWLAQPSCVRKNVTEDLVPIEDIPEVHPDLQKKLRAHGISCYFPGAPASGRGPGFLHSSAPHGGSPMLTHQGPPPGRAAQPGGHRLALVPAQT